MPVAILPAAFYYYLLVLLWEGGGYDHSKSVYMGGKTLSNRSVLVRSWKLNKNQ